MLDVKELTNCDDSIWLVEPNYSLHLLSLDLLYESYASSFFCLLTLFSLLSFHLLLLNKQSLLFLMKHHL